MVKVVRYNSSMKAQWDEFLLTARNSTLLHLRNYMDYHADRFEDHSLVFIDDHEHVIALLPACKSNKDSGVIASHEGLTYGGFVVARLLHASTLQEIMQSTISYYKNLGAKQLVIKPIPHIYASMPCEEELYFISQAGGKLTHRALSQAIDLSVPAEYNQLRKRCIAKARQNGIVVEEAQLQEEWNEYHEILSNVLASRHETTPVHSPEELWMLHQRFTNEIRLFVARKEDKIIAGTVVYTSPTVAHTQYLASSPEGQASGALDLVIDHVLTLNRNCAVKYLDFGISTERDGSLNPGLTLQKEGFGARGICYDTYTITL